MHPKDKLYPAPPSEEDERRARAEESSPPPSISIRLSESSASSLSDVFEDVNVEPSSAGSSSSAARRHAEVVELVEMVERSLDGDGRARPDSVSPASRQDESSSIAPISPVDPRLGEVLNDRYKLEKLVGKGGMGRVYRAIQFPLNRAVAVKILNPEFQRKDPQFVRRFFLEAASAARLSHPNTITVFDYGEAKTGELFIVMEYLKGRPLSRVISAEAPFAAERTIHVAMQICRALREAHSKGIIHRDLKPGNILLLEGGDDADFVKVLDFGLVKLFTPAGGGQEALGEPLTPGPDVEPELTRAGMFLGSPKYMSPEQIQGHNLDPRTDIYSLGVLMYQMSTGKPPFSGATSVEVIYKHVNHPVPRIHEVAPGAYVPEELERVIQKCLAKSRDDRFASMAELLVRLKDVRKLVTGISAASETGVALEPLPRFEPSRDLPEVVRRDGEPSLASASGPSSRRPATRPSTPPPRSEPRSGKIRVTEVPREVAFQELESDTPSPLVRPGSRRVEAAWTRYAPWMAGGALAVALGVMAYVFSSAPGREATAERPVAPPGPPVGAATRVAFTSEPPGAEVFEGALSLGKTPFTKVMPREAADAVPRRFLFRLTGHQDSLVVESISDDVVDVRAQLRPAKDRPPAEEDPDYKENPY